MDATELIIEWLADAPETAEEAATQAAVGEWLAHADDAASDAGERITLQELNDLRKLLDTRIRNEGELKGLREHLAQWAAQAAPREMSDVKGMVDWSLGQVDWRAVHAFLATEAGIAAQRMSRDGAGDRFPNSDRKEDR